MARRTSTLLSAIVLACLALAIALPGRAAARPAGDALSGGERATLLRYAADTWQSFVAMTDPATGLPADNIDATTKTRAAYTSPTNIAAYIWATLAARDLQIIQPSDARARIAQTLVHLGVDLSEVVTRTTMAKGLEYALARTGQRVIRADNGRGM